MTIACGLKILKYFPKKGKSFFVTETGLGKAGNYAIDFTKNGKASVESKALIGDTSLTLENYFKGIFDDTINNIQYLFANSPSVTKVFGRPKSAMSITTKLERMAKPKGKLSSLDEGISFIEDGIATRGLMKSLPKLSKNDISEQIAKTTFEGKPLSKRQAELLEKYIYERPIDDKHKQEAFQLFNEFCKPLVEKHSKEAIDTLTMGVLAQKLKNGEATLEQIKKEGLLDKNLIAEFEERLQNQDILPISINKINNYKGANGIAYFTDSQVAQLNYVRGLSSKEGAIINRNASPTRFNYMQDNTKVEQPLYKLKDSGYNTGQMYVIDEKGIMTEIQLRGIHTNDFAEFEHIAYDLRQGKNTLGEVFNEYAEVISKLPDSQYTVYNKYLESCYNYCHRLELGLPAQKPKLPESLNPILSMDSMEALHHKANLLQKADLRGFSPYFEAVA